MASVVPQLLLKGPLSTALGQWLFLGFGTVVLFTGDNGVSAAAQSVASVAYKLITGGDHLTDRMVREALLANQAFQQQLNAQMLELMPARQQQAPIVIHANRNANGGWTATVVQLSLGAGGIWAVYVLASSYLPDGVKEMMPVTRHFFEASVSKLASGVLKVRETLGQQITALSGKQDQLSSKQDETHGQVLGIKDDLGEVRMNVDDIAVAISRCETSLEDAAGRQMYMSHGVRLLVHCVVDLLRPSNPKVAEELDQFSRLNSDLDGDYNYARGVLEGKERRKKLEYPASPLNLSEIGSSDDEHPHGQMALRPTRTKRTAGAGGQPPSAPPSFMGSLKSFHSFGGAGGRSTASTAPSSVTTPSVSQSAPDCSEVSSSDYYEESYACSSGPRSAVSDPAQEDEVEQLLGSFVKSRSSIQAVG